MSMIEDMQAHVPQAFEEIARQTHMRPTSVGITRKGRRLAFGVSLPSAPDCPGPDLLFGFPVVYWVVSAPSLLHAGN